MSPKQITRREVLLGLGAAGVTTMLTQCSPKQTVVMASDYPDADVSLPLLCRRSASGRLNFILILCDTLRYDHIGFHGFPIQTPNIDAFAAQSVVFNQAYSGGFPTVLNRAELLTGRYTFAYMGWEDLPDDEVVIAAVLNNAGYITGLVFDTPHYRAERHTFDREFHSWEWVRGQESDRWSPTPRQPELPADPSKFRYGAEVVEQYLRNMSHRQVESDWLSARTMQAAIDWLHRNHSEGPFFLHVDSFDPHEPWDPPHAYTALYNPGYTGQEVIYPAYAPVNYLTPEELNHVRALYAGEVSLVDHWLGVLLQEIDDLGLRDNTVVILTSDHGILLGEHNVIGKAWSHEGHFEAYPLYQELVHIPLMIRVPGVAPRQTAALAQPADLMPTVLELAQIAVPDTVQGSSLLKVLEHYTGNSAHTTVVASRPLQSSLSSKPRMTVADGEWTLIHGGGHVSSALYYLPDDPLQEDNLLSSECTTARTLHAELVTFLTRIGAPSSYLSTWLTPPC
jgi:arylsulfatase A-like enzyme